MSDRTLSTTQKRDYTIGKQLFICNQPEILCQTDEQKIGYQRAKEQRALKQSLKTPEQSPVEFWTNYNADSLNWRTNGESFSRTYSDGDVEIYHDCYGDWITVELYGVCILDTRPAWNATSAGVYAGKAICPKTNSNYDYESRREPNERVLSVQ